MNTECAKFIGRLKEICEGSANLPLSKVNKYRLHWSLPPLTDENRPEVRFPAIQPTPSPPRKPSVRLSGFGPGSVLIQMYAARGMPHCQACFDLAVLMDQWGPDESQVRLEWIVQDILPRAKDWIKANHPWVHRLLPGVVEDAAVLHKLRSDVREAISKSRKLLLNNPRAPKSEVVRVRRGARKTTSQNSSSSSPQPCVGCGGNGKRSSQVAVKWSYGITATLSRKDSHLSRTVASLVSAGFDSPVVFMDDGESFRGEGLDNCVIVRRASKLGAFSNFVLAAWELYARHPEADRFLIFQDDIVTYKNLRQYLEACGYQSRSWYNLYTWPCNVKAEDSLWSSSLQGGRGALALMFDNATLCALLASDYFVNHRKRNHKAIDKAVMMSLREKGFTEMVHNPSLVQHTGMESTIKNNPMLTSPVFKGEDFDALRLISPVTEEALR